MGTREHAEQRLGQIARPGFDPRGVTPQSAQRRDAPIAIDQDQALAAVLGYRDAGDELAALFDRARQMLDRARVQHPHLGKAQVQAVQIHFLGCGGGGIHDANASSLTLECL